MIGYKPSPNERPHFLSPMSSPDLLGERPTATVTPVKKQKRALLVGCNYRGPNQLYGCINDVIEMRSLLIGQYGYSSKDIVVLRDDMPNSMPTKLNILSSIKDLIKGADANTVLCFHYSGHGSSIRDANNDEEDRKDEVIVPTDFEKSGFIVDDDLRKALIDPLPMGCQLRCIFDCCNSGTTSDLRYSYGPQPATNVRHAETLADVICVSGCKDNQTSADAYLNNESGGALTVLLRSVLAENRYAPSCYKLITNLQTEMKLNNFTQIPILTTGKQTDILKTIFVL